MTALQSQSTSNPTSIAQAAAVAALTGPAGVRARHGPGVPRAPRRRAGRGCAQSRASRTMKPEGAFYVFPDVSAHFGRRGPDGVIASANDLGAYLLRHAERRDACRARASAPRGTSACRTPRTAPCSKRGCCGSATAWRASPEAHPAVYCRKQKRRRLITLAFFELPIGEADALLAHLRPCRSGRARLPRPARPTPASARRCRVLGPGRGRARHATPRSSTCSCGSHPVPSVPRSIIRMPMPASAFFMRITSLWS